VLSLLRQHPNDRVRGIGCDLEEHFRQVAEQITDIEHIRSTSPLQRGLGVALHGGYDEACEKPWWLNRRECYYSRFIDFSYRGPDKMPAALIELEEEIDLTEGSSTRHRGVMLR